MNLHNDTGNESTYRADINASRGEIQLNRENISSNHEDIGDQRNATHLDRTTIRETRQEDIQLRQTNNASWLEVRQNTADIRSDRQQIRNDRGEKDSTV